MVQYYWVWVYTGYGKAQYYLGMYLLTWDLQPVA